MKLISRTDKHVIVEIEADELNRQLGVYLGRNSYGSRITDDAVIIDTLRDVFEQHRKAARVVLENGSTVRVIRDALERLLAYAEASEAVTLTGIDREEKP